MTAVGAAVHAGNPAEASRQFTRRPPSPSSGTAPGPRSARASRCTPPSAVRPGWSPGSSARKRQPLPPGANPLPAEDALICLTIRQRLGGPMAVAQNPDHWQIQEAKQRFSEVIRAVTQDGPRIITAGEEVAVIIDMAEYHRLARPAVNLTEVLLGGPKLDDDDMRCSPRSRLSGRRTSAASLTFRRTHDVVADTDVLSGRAGASRTPVSSNGSPSPRRTSCACRC